ncbi:MAG: TIGR03560 family F420-dependent LLM class oxidoreductase [Actinomycetota bacterium]|nr:TIGR03560 family F420-dependent LLM class oxidoreductase [Actinomycetota bacterium]
MRFSFWVGNGHSWEHTLDACRHAEASGWDGIWFADHLMPLGEGRSGPVQEAWTTLAGLAAAVPRVRLGPLVSGNTYRNPALLAKMATTVDHISGGRVVLGIGAGWQENEHRAFGFEYRDFPWRFDRLEEACAVITSLLRDHSASLDGQHYTIVDAPLDPAPVQERLPLLIGGGGERRTLRLVARWADEWNVWGTPETLVQKGEVLERRCEEVDRDPATIARSAVALLFMSDDAERLASLRAKGIGRPSIIGTPEEVGEIVAAYAEAGVDELIIPDFTFSSAAERDDTLDRFIGEVAAAHR